MSSSVDQGVGLSQGDSPPRLVRPLLGGHPDTVDDGTDADAQSAARTVGGHTGEVCLGVKGDCLVA